MSLTSRIATAILVLFLGGSVLACDLLDPPGEVATARLRVDPGPDPSLQDLMVAEATAARYADQAESRSVALAVVGKLGLDRSASDLQGAIDVDAEEETLELIIEVRDEDPEAARSIALALGDEMIERVERSLVEETVERDRGSDMQRQIDELFEDIVEPRAERGGERTIKRNRLVWSEKPALPKPAEE